MTLKIIIIQLNPITEFDQDHNEWLEKRPFLKIMHFSALVSRGLVRKENRKRNRQSILVSLHGIKFLTRALNFLFFLILDNAHGNKPSNSLITLKLDWYEIRMMLLNF